MPLTLSQKPARIICGMRTRPVPKTIALGGVPTGIMKAQPAAMVEGGCGASSGPATRPTRRYSRDSRPHSQRAAR